MVEIILRLTEEELKEIIHNKFESVCIGDSMDYEVLYEKYFDSLIDSGNAPFFYSPINLDEWIKDTIDKLIVVTPTDSNYKHIYDCLQKDQFDVGDGYFIVANYNNVILLEYYT